MLYRVYYENGFWGDELASDKASARAKGDSLAAANNTRVLKVEPQHRC